jgi:hypothetical protein
VEDVEVWRNSVPLALWRDDVGRRSATPTLATGIVILRSHTLPRWLGWLSILIAIIGVAGPIGFIAVIASGLWVLILAGYFYREVLHPAGATAARTIA